ncbi:hypothetical protein TVAG_097950 [Trichomonas vaginalis G3]|uniref:receptor protein-tyrosine kinase n=1 Tax=Trichomonas vaginalis (strain ATCC PRA-98 / G3) TaxID=412133 RepID=A2E2C5_TRIV3|nr:glycine-rich protein family [Trichomonas vaginalis G3]EAY13225.1 hypothetical protein TVAG_097950 [Trichomonas vaginalis G3]KAI5488143.1 glycine-rich protein family [Trichomonas vaginalis G3]|eukprot:XP_001325448.1 hypothetical protein [Trichomonas vaginalis G3]
MNSDGFNCNNVHSKISGGGATDIRLVKTANWFDFDSLKSRIMVAAGAGSGERICGGDGGGLNGLSTSQLISTDINSQLNATTGATQTSGGIFGCDVHFHICGYSGQFGIGGSGNNYEDSGPSGGGGYYGGGGMAWAGSASGGSSFISGHRLCNAISKYSTASRIYHTGNPKHYSGKYFTDTTMIDGQHRMPSPNLNSYEIGHQGNGYAIITYIAKNVVCSCRVYNFRINLFIFTNHYMTLGF